MALQDPPPFERFTERARDVVIRAQEEARAMAHNYIGTEHLLLGLLTAGPGVSATALKSLRVEPDLVREKIVQIVGRGEEAPTGQIPFTPRSKRVLQWSLPEAEALGHNYIGTEHLLLAYSRESEGVGGRILLDFDVGSERLRDTTMATLLERMPKTAPDPQSDSEPAESEGEEAGPEEGSLPSPEPLETVPTHRDRPASEDELGRAQLAEVLGERIRRARGEDTEGNVETRGQRKGKRRRDREAAKRMGSFMVHVYAPWGSGKSSLLNFLAADLRNRAPDGGEPANSSLSQWIVVEFSAWEHQRLVAPWWWLLAEVQRACSRELWQIDRWRWLCFRARDLAWRLWNARAAGIAALILLVLAGAAWALDWFGLTDESLTFVRTALLTAMAALALGGSVFGLIRGTSKWMAIGSAEGAVRFLRRAHDPLGVYRRRFRWLIRSARRPITIFIDDLDRCRPEYVVELLEGIQTLFANEPVAYVVAADRAWVCESFARSYSEFEGSVGDPGRPLGFLFLEKTFQISQEIPPMPENDRHRYWAKLLRGGGGAARRRRNVVDGEAAKDRAIERLVAASTQADMDQGVEEVLRSEEIVAEDEVLQAVVRRLNAPDEQEQLGGLLSEFTQLLENNPRAMKRLINAYGVERDRLLRAGHVLSRDERRQLALLTILRLRWPLFADHLRRFPGDAKLFRKGPKGAPSDHPFRVLYEDPEVRGLFSTMLSEGLDPALLREFPPRSAPDSTEPVRA